MIKTRNIILGKISKFLIIFFIMFFQKSLSYSENLEQDLVGNYIEIKILDKLSSKNEVLKIKIGEEKKYKNLLIKCLKCRNSQFDDNPEIVAYIQVRDLNDKNNDKVFVFNGWTFSSSPTIKPFDHPVYDIWLTKCIK
tara:strand:- start:8186 stop:8599 length:414 start_codon:yes stop_codon:yes gene_type:complete